jgi:hypothetical protein
MHPIPRCHTCELSNAEKVHGTPPFLPRCLCNWGTERWEAKFWIPQLENQVRKALLCTPGPSGQFEPAECRRPQCGRHIVICSPLPLPGSWAPAPPWREESYRRREPFVDKYTPPPPLPPTTGTLQFLLASSHELHSSFPGILQDDR